MENGPLGVEQLVREYAAELLPSPEPLSERIKEYLGATALGLVVAIGTASALWSGEAWPTGRYTLLVVSVVLGTIALAERFMRVEHHSRVERTLRDLVEDPGQIYEAVARNFRKEIQAQRDRTLGPESEWSRAWAPLLESADQANRSAAYWRQRLVNEPEDERLASQLKTAERLEQKFGDAIKQLDERRRTLNAFFNDCEARVAMLEQGRRDYEESRRLVELSDRADLVIEEARTTLDGIGHQFLAEAIRVSEALGGLETLQLLELAGESPLDRIEAVAEQILEAAALDRRAIQALLLDLRSGA